MVTGGNHWRTSPPEPSNSAFCDAPGTASRVTDVPSGPHPGTVAAYERGAGAWTSARTADSRDRAAELGHAVERRRSLDPSGSSAGGGRTTVDLGCGPGWHVPALPQPSVALDASRAMLDLVSGHAPGAPRVRADLARLPFSPGSIAAAFATKAYVHLGAPEVPRALADLHRALDRDAPIVLSFFGSGPTADEASVDDTGYEGDPFPGRRFSLWHLDDLTAVVEGAGFEVDDLDMVRADDSVPHVWVTGRRRRTLPDTVGPGMRLLVCGLNPSLHAADAGVGFVTPGNRFWPAAIAAGLVSRDRDPFHALDHHGVGMTDLAKRATRRADELDPDEYRAGLVRFERTVRWLRPGAVCFVGLAGYRVAVDRRARPGPQERPLGSRPVYVMPSTSGLNTHSRLDDLTDHLRGALALSAGA